MRLLSSLSSDLRYGVRALLGSPGFCLIVVASLALGIGANTAVFTLVKALLLEPVPVHEPSRLVAVLTRDQELPGMLPTSFPNYEDLRDSTRTLSSLAAYMPIRPSLSRPERPLKLDGVLVSGNYFDVLGVRPEHGRFFLPEEDETVGARPVAVVSHRLWREQLGGDAGVVGSTIPLNGSLYTVVGITPPGFGGADVLSPADVFVPLAMRDQMLFGAAASWFELRGALLLRLVGRMEDGTSLDQVRSELQTLSWRLEEEYPADNEQRQAEAIPFLQATINPNLRGNYVLGGGLLMATVVLILLIACANVANLVLARGVRRQREIAVRLALGVGRWRLVRQLLAESLVLAFLGGVLGLGVAVAAKHVLWSVRPPEVPGSLDVSLDPGVLVFALLLTLATGLLFGLLPALKASRPDLVSSLKSGGRSASSGPRRLPLHQLLVVLQVALSLLVLIGAGLFLRALRSAQDIDVGYRSNGVVVASFDLAAQGYGKEQAQQLYRRAVEDLEALPGVESATIGQNLPFVTLALLRPATVPGYAGANGEETLYLQYQAVGSGYFETLGIPVLAGRAFTDADRGDSRPVVIVNQTTAERLWPDRDAVGQQLTFSDTSTRAEVVGVVRDAKYNFLGEDPQLYAYLPLQQEHAPAATLFVRSGDGHTDVLMGEVREQMRRLDPRLPLYNLQELSTVVERTLWAPRLGASLLGLLGLVAVALAAVGVYGVMAYSVSQRNREMAVRIALGSQRSGVLSLVLARGMRVVAAGLALGLLLAWLSTRGVASLLFGIRPLDPLVYAVTSLILALVALAANYLPARRATRADPAEVLADE